MTTVDTIKLEIAKLAEAVAANEATERTAREATLLSITAYTQGVIAELAKLDPPVDPALVITPAQLADIVAKLRALTELFLVPDTTLPVVSVSIDPAQPTVAVGASLTLVATAKDATGNVVARPVAWGMVGSGHLITDPASGLITGAAPGTPTVTATVDGVVGSTVVTVTP